MKTFGFYRKDDDKKETLSKSLAISRLQAAKFFAARKGLQLKQFLAIYTITK